MFWGVTKKEGRSFLKIKFYERVILSCWGITRNIQGVIRKTSTSVTTLRITSTIMEFGGQAL